MKITTRTKAWLGGLIGLATLVAGMVPLAANAHGERAQEPFLRTRSIQFYDVQFDKTKVNVNEEFTITGKARFLKDWAEAVSQPDTVYLSAVSPGPVVTKVSTYLNEVPAMQSFSKMELGRDYEFRMKYKARAPGRHHIHPTIAVKGSGALVGPGEWMEVGGSRADFTYPTQTMTGEKIENLESVGVAHAVKWHLVWIVLAAGWLVYWLARPLLLPRWIALNKGREDLLVGRRDLAVGIGLGAVVVVLVFGGYAFTASAYPYNVPLQTGGAKIEPLPKPPHDAEIKTLNATYDVPGRSMRMTLIVTNNGPKPLEIGEFATANVRFVNKELDAAVANVHKSYPKELVPRVGLKISDPSPIDPGETRELTIEATDAVWELERIVSFLTDVESKFGALLFLYSDTGERHIAEIGGPILPVFTKLPALVSKQRKQRSDAQMEIDPIQHEETGPYSEGSDAIEQEADPAAQVDGFSEPETEAAAEGAGT